MVPTALVYGPWGAKWSTGGSLTAASAKNPSVKEIVLVPNSSTVRVWGRLRMATESKPAPSSSVAVVLTTPWIIDRLTPEMVEVVVKVTTPPVAAKASASPR